MVGAEIGSKYTPATKLREALKGTIPGEARAAAFLSVGMLDAAKSEDGLYTVGRLLLGVAKKHSAEKRAYASHLDDTYHYHTAPDYYDHAKAQAKGIFQEFWLSHLDSLTQNRRVVLFSTSYQRAKVAHEFVAQVKAITEENVNAYNKPPSR